VAVGVVTTCWSAFDDWAELHIELGVGDSNAPTVDTLWGAARWSAATSHWSGLEPSWLDVTGRMLEANVQRGRRNWTDRIGMSSAVVAADNADGWLTWNSATLGTQDVRPGRPLRLWARIVADGAHRDLWRGFVEGIDDAYDPGQRPKASVRAQDALAQVAHVDLPEQSPLGAGERTDVRVGRVLDNADWPASWRMLEQGQVTVQATNLARNLADELGITADSEGGAAYAGTDGRVYFRNRDWLRVAPYATTVQATIGPAGAVCASEHTVVRDAADIRNDVQLARAGGTMQRYVDADSVALYRRRTYQRGDLICETDPQVQLLAQRIVGSRSKSTVRLTDVTVPVVDAASAGFVASVDYGWRLVVQWEDASESWSREVHVMGVNHHIRPTGWTCTLAVDDAVAQPTQPWGAGRWGSAKWTEAA
jgi:hypothetical protein